MMNELFISVDSPKRHHLVSHEASGVVPCTMMVPIHLSSVRRTKMMSYSAEATFRERRDADGKVSLFCSEVTLSDLTGRHEKKNYAEALRFIQANHTPLIADERQLVTVVFVGPEPGDYTFEFMPVNLDWKAEQYVDIVAKGRSWKGKAIMTRSIRDVE